MKRFALWLALSAFAAGVAAETFVASVAAVIDGDTVVVTQDRKKLTVRLAGIDAPEIKQPYGAASRDGLSALVLRKTVQVTPAAVDEYGRVIATLNMGRININAAQVHHGLAWENSLHHSDKTLLALQKEAQRARRGLWADANPQPPWEFRKAHAPSREIAPSATGGACGKKHYCSQMVSCSEARYYYEQCRVKTLDKDGDGVPCESLCAPRKP